jgi:alkaline phosphatase
VVDTESPTYHQETLIPLSAETHGGEDVAIYATGPSAYLFRGVKEQNYVFEVMAYSLKLRGDK